MNRSELSLRTLGTTGGSDMELPFQSSQRPQEEPRFADLSTCSRNGDSHPLLEPRHFQDAKLNLVYGPLRVCLSAGMSESDKEIAKQMKELEKMTGDGIKKRR